MNKLFGKCIAALRNLNVGLKALLIISSIMIIGTTAMAIISGEHMYAVLSVSWLCTLYIISRYIFYPKSVDNKQAQSKAESLVKVYRDTTEALAYAIAAKDSFEQHHISRVQTICDLVARDLGLNENDRDGIRVAALVHDVGKLGVPEHILLKPGPLDPEEFARMRNHAAIGAKILEKVSYPWDVVEMVKHHHEKYDGSGYPDKLKGDGIPLGARIIAVAEVYDSLISQRCYRDGWTHMEAVEHIEKLAGSHFDPEVVKAFLNVESQIGLLSENHDSHADSEQNDDDQIEQCCVADIIAQANRELLSLFEIAQTLSSTLELDEVLTMLAHRTKRLSQAATCAVFMVDEDNPNHLVSRVAVGRYQEIIKGSYVKLGKGTIGKAAQHSKPYSGHYDPNDLFFNMDGHMMLDLKSCLAAPIVSFGEIIGTINLYDVSVNAFSEDDMRTLTFVANIATVAIQNARAFEKVRDSAMKDSLTGLYNGRHLRIFLERELSRAERQEIPVSVLGIDLDNFKTVNDLLGHQAGDKALKDAAEIFKSQLRDYDLVVRNGGDEFVVVLPGVSTDEAQKTAERIRSGIDEYSATVNLNNGTTPLGVSVGVACYPDDADDLEALLAKADERMYADKRSRKQSRLVA